MSWNNAILSAIALATAVHLSACDSEEENAAENSADASADGLEDRRDLVASPANETEELNAVLSVNSDPVAFDINRDVPYLRQQDYPGIAGSACAPTSIAMMLRYYYPNSNIDVPEIYHAGLQNYNYKGPAHAYRNLSLADGDPKEAAIPPDYADHYNLLNHYTGARSVSHIQKYLNVIWGINSEILYSDSQVYAALERGPLIGHVYAQGNHQWGHYLVILGYDDKGTPSRSDDTIFVNDPDGRWWANQNGKNRSISHHNFFVRGQHGSAWFRDAIELIPQDTASEREHTVIVDTGHNIDDSGNDAHHQFRVDDSRDRLGNTSEFTWWMVYSPDGDYYYPRESGHAARWTPKLTATGQYLVAVKFLATPASGVVTYRIYNADEVQLLEVPVDQHARVTKWDYKIIAESISLSNGAYVRATDIPAETNIDAVKFKYLRR
ncbi:MAG: C39 family peptidase [Enhygromyxa sp.]